MTLQLTDAVSDGIRRTVSATGGIAFVLLLLLQLLSLASANTLVASQLPPELTGPLGLTLPVSGTVAGVLLAGSMLLSAIYFVFVARAFARPRAELSSLPAALYTRRMGRATLSMLVGGVVVGIAVVIGFFLLFLPGVFLAACFLFFIFAVGVEDRGVLGALKRSWGLARGHRLKLGIFVVFVGILSMIVSVPTTLLRTAGEPIVGDLVTAVANALVFTFVYGIMAALYAQLRDGNAPRRSRPMNHAHATTSR